MGERGPAPKRSGTRMGHRAKGEDNEVIAIEIDEPAIQPDSGIGWSAQAVNWYESLAESAQSRFYEPSDWQAAFFCAELMTHAFEGENGPNGAVIAQIRGIMTDLMCTESSRRRVGLEITRPEAPKHLDDDKETLEDIYNDLYGDKPQD